MGVCCYTFLKFIVMIFNLLYMILGGALLGTSLWMYLDGASMAPVTQDIEGYNYVLYFLMAVGAVMFIMGFLGCCGAFQESQCMLATFFALVFVLFIGQIGAGIWLKTNEERFTKLAEESLAKSIQHDYGFNDLKTQAFDVIQSELKCCGSIGPTDWADSRFNGANDNTMEIGIAGALGSYNTPESCCVSKGTTCEIARKLTLSALIAETIYKEGCAKKMLQLMETHSYELLGVVGAILLIEILAMIFSMVLCCTVRRIDHVKA
ncbi:LOW QUALITY PROTEIN: tetraspanin-1 [Procambarus clarkii]|uniref:Tetraspanin n=1 Tax=Procambarus clarkii TaxID=6728 RepID=A0A7T1FRA9_PROCL|nr:tetraspanin-1-like [Procambarus clarkii]QPM92671.1 tetraspanin-1-like [Procambarus clarkii]